MIEETSHQLENENVHTEKPLVYTFKVIQDLQNASEKQHPPYRGRDRKPRKTHVNSLLNLKPFQSISDVTKLEQYTRGYSSKPSFSWKFWIVLLIILGIIIGVYFIWKYFKEKRERAYNSDNLPNIFYKVKSNG